MGVFDRQIETARRLIERYGEVCQWVKPGIKDGDAKPWVETSLNVPAPIPVKIVFFPHGAETNFSAVIAALGDTDVPIASEYGLMPVVNFNPAISDSVMDSQGRVIEIVKMTPLAPNGEIVFWKLWVER